MAVMVQTLRPITAVAEAVAHQLLALMDLVLLAATAAQAQPQAFLAAALVIPAAVAQAYLEPPQLARAERAAAAMEQAPLHLQQAQPIQVVAAAVVAEPARELAVPAQQAAPASSSSSTPYPCSLS